MAVGLGAAVYLGLLPLNGLRARLPSLWQRGRTWGAAVRGLLGLGGSCLQGISWLFFMWWDEAIILAQRGWALMRRPREPAPAGENVGSLVISRLLEAFDTLRETLACLDGQLAESTADVAAEKLLEYRETLERAHQTWIDAIRATSSQLQEALAASTLPDGTAHTLQSAIHEHLEALQTLLVDLADLEPCNTLRARAILRGSVVNMLELSQDMVDRLLGTLAAYDQSRGPAALPAIEQQDPLTGLPNLRGLESWLQPRRARPSASEGLAGVLVYVDGLEAINRKWGIHVGDRVLVEVARLVRKSARPPRLAARICGPQFLLLLPTRSVASAQRIAEQLRRKVEALRLAALSEPPQITATCLAALCDPTQPADTLVRQLHRALYERLEWEPNHTWLLEEGVVRRVTPSAAPAASQVCSTR